MYAKNLGLLGDMEKLIENMKWTRFYQQPQSYNTQIVKEFYANLVDTNNKKCEVVVRGVKFSYSEGNINMLFKLGLVEYRYQELLLTSYEVDYDVYMESLCNPDTKWVETGGEKTMKIMDLRSESKVWYKFIKHSLRPTTHNETVNKARLVLFHYITYGEGIHVG